MIIDLATDNTFKDIKKAIDNSRSVIAGAITDKYDEDVTLVEVKDLRTIDDVTHVSAGHAIRSKFSEVYQLLDKKVNKEDLTNDITFKGSDTTDNIKAKTDMVNGDKWYSTDENVYYMYSSSGWINCGSGENLALIENEVGELKKSITIDYARSIKSTVNGTFLNLTDSADAPVQKIEVHGKNYINLNNFVDGIDTTYTVEGSNITVTGKWFIKNILSLEKNVPYVFSLDGDNPYSIKLFDEKMKTILMDTSGKTFKFKPSYSGKFCLAIYVSAGTEQTLTFSNIQFEEGISATPYEPYTKDIDVTVCGKNLISTLVHGIVAMDGSFGEHKYYARTNEIYVKNNTKLLISKGINDNALYIIKAEYDINGNLINRVNSLKFPLVYTPFNNEISKVIFVFYAEVSDLVILENNNYQIEYGDGQTSYEEYKGKTVTIDTETQTGCEALETYYPVTNIIPTQSANIDIEYIADTKNYIDNKFMELTALTLEG